MHGHSARQREKMIPSFLNRRACAARANAVIAIAIPPGNRMSIALMVSPRSARIITACCAIAGTNSCQPASRIDMNSGTIGVKTGSGPEAKYCLVFAATRGGKTVIGTVLASSSIAQRESDAKKLMSYGFTKI